ncbi:hypothetical protein EST38_g5184 [Candolleomyces aberdarensis]|uniref:C2H2-type domain-containing protein n=1 Tax=Candolleomyces aberdarensis TaxID=2316362 RepID=A0A4Q2DL22_9AGAR|nr:hypothetical protein EST38_g5184 [Candolleomyces aberdarensis]
MIEHFDIAHLSRIPLICPIVGCSSQRLLKASDLPQHLRDYHEDVCTKPPPLGLDLFIPTLRPRVPCLEPPPPLPSGPIYGLTPVRKGLRKQTPRTLPPSPSKRIPRNPRQVPGSSAALVAEDEDSEVDMDIEDLEPLSNVPNIQKRRTVIARKDDIKSGQRSDPLFSIPEEKANQMMVVGKRDEKLDKDLSRPGPMLDPSVYGERIPPVSIYFPAFKRMVEGLIEKEKNPNAKSLS